MKKLTILIITLSVIGVGAVFAQDEAPTTTWGVDGAFGYNVFSSQKTVDDTDGSGDGLNDVASNTPYGLAASNFVVAPWFQVDWERLMVKMTGRYDQLNHDDADNYSNVKLSSTYSELFGVFTLYNDFLYRVAEDSGDEQMEFDSHKLGLGLAVDDFSARVNWVYDNGGRFLGTDPADDGTEAQSTDSLDQAVGDIAGLNQFYSFSDLTVSMDNGVVGAMTKWKALDDPDVVAPGYYLTNAYLKGYDWFGVWDMTVGDQANAKKLRMAGLGPRGYTSQMGIGEFGASSFGFVDSDGEDVAEVDRKIDVYNVFGLVPGFSLKLGTIMPMDDESDAAKWNNWLAEGNLFLGVEYVIEGVATVNTGVGIVNDYFVESEMDYVVSQNGDAVDDDTGTSIGTIGNRSNAWLDVALTPMEALKVQLGVDAQYSRYRDAKKQATDATDYTYVDFSLYNIGFEAAYSMAPMTINAGVYTALGMGFDYETFTGTKFDDAFNDDAAGVENMSNFTERNAALAALYSDEAFDGDDSSLISPFIIDVSLGYKVSETISVSVGNKFNALAGAVGDAPIANNDDGDFDAVAAPGTADKTVRGYYGTNTISLGTTVVPAENQSLGVNLGYTLYTGVPEEGDFYTNANDDQSAEYTAWRTNEFQPLSLGVTYSYKY